MKVTDGYTPRLLFAHVNYLNMFLLPPPPIAQSNLKTGYSLTIEVNLNGTIDKVN